MEYAAVLKEFGPIGFLVLFIATMIFAVGKFGKQAFAMYFQKVDDLQKEIRKQDAEKEKFYKNQLEIQRQESDARLKIQKDESNNSINELKKELSTQRKQSEEKEKSFMQQLGKIANILDKIEINFNNKLDEVNRNLSDQIKNIEEKIN